MDRRLCHTRLPYGTSSQLTRCAYTRTHVCASVLKRDPAGAHASAAARRQLLRKWGLSSTGPTAGASRSVVTGAGACRSAGRLFIQGVCCRTSQRLAARAIAVHVLPWPAPRVRRSLGAFIAAPSSPHGPCFIAAYRCRMWLAPVAALHWHMDSCDPCDKQQGVGGLSTAARGNLATTLRSEQSQQRQQRAPAFAYIEFEDQMHASAESTRRVLAPEACARPPAGAATTPGPSTGSSWCGCVVRDADRCNAAVECSWEHDNMAALYVAACVPRACPEVYAGHTLTPSSDATNHPTACYARACVCVCVAACGALTQRGH